MPRNEPLLRQIAGQVLETMAFAMVMPRPESPDAPVPESEPAVCATVRFDGAATGTLSLTVPRAAVNELSANMLSQDDATEQQRLDAIGELANIICGNVLPTLLGQSAVFNLARPQVLAVGLDPAPDADLATVAPTTATRLDLEQGWAQVQLTLDAPAMV